MLSDDLQDLGNIDINSVPIPPLLFAVVTCKESDLGAVGQEMFDLDHIRVRALGAVHINSLLLGVATCYCPPRLTTTSPPPKDARRTGSAFDPLRSSRRTNKDRGDRCCTRVCHSEPPADGVAPGDDLVR